VITAIGLLLLLGACGKSAQLPLQSWLLDAMEGPTPVSALIHAATMVTAGVYLIVRSAPIFNLSANARLLVTIVGAATLLFGAIIGCAKDDIKKALAGSTMSQIGYMMLAAGLGPVGYALAIAHLLSHGFFKAGLFLGAGSVKHEMNDEVTCAPVRRAPTAMKSRSDVHVRLQRHRRTAVLWLLHQGPDHRDRLRQRRHLGCHSRHLRADRRRPHGVLHDTGDADDLQRQAPVGGRRSPARSATGHDLPDGHPRDRVARRGRLPHDLERLIDFLKPVTGTPPLAHGSSRRRQGGAGAGRSVGRVR
jgi:hypothetical protein